MQTFKKLLFLINFCGKKRSVFILIVAILTATLDIIGVSTILPFVAVLTNPTLIETNSILNIIFKISSLFGVKNNQEFIFFLAFFFFLFLIISLIFRGISAYAQAHFVQMCEFTISQRLIEGYLHQPYSWFLTRNSSDLRKSVLSDVNYVAINGIYPLIELISKCLIAIIFLTLLFIVEPKLTILVIFFFIIIYLLIFSFLHKKISKIAKERFKNNQIRFEKVGETFSALKEIKFLGLEKSFSNLFLHPNKILARSQALLSIAVQLPRLILEGFIFGGIFLIIFYIIGIKGSFSNALPIISFYILSGYRLTPVFQQIYFSFTQMLVVGLTLDRLYKDLKNINSTNQNRSQKVLSLNKAITLKNIYYNYPNTSRVTLKNITLNITAKSKVGIIGRTGSGKTTMIDIILGLIEPQKGTLEVDGNLITEKNVRSWQSSIGYVPQHIFLSNDTIAANIAFGVAHKDINQDMVAKVCKIANLHEFILDELSNQYQTVIGERGISLSGGQRQRIAIARALYSNPKVLVLDEATNALDNETEKIVLENIYNFNKNLTFIIISHRLDIVKTCDIIFKIDKGKIIAEKNLVE